MYTVNVSIFRSLFLRNDDVTEGNCKNDILRNAVKTEEEYFVIPSGMSSFKMLDFHKLYFAY